MQAAPSRQLPWKRHSQTCVTLPLLAAVADLLMLGCLPADDLPADLDCSNVHAEVASQVHLLVEAMAVLVVKVARNSLSLIASSLPKLAVMPVLQVFVVILILL